MEGKFSEQSLSTLKWKNCFKFGIFCGAKGRKGGPLFPYQLIKISQSLYILRKSYNLYLLGTS